MNILTRYVLAEFLKICILALLLLTGMMLIVGVVREATMQSLPLGEVARLLPYILPDALRVAIPVAILLASTFVYGRLSGTNEVVAVKSLGISPTRLLWPVWGLVFAVSLLTVWLNDVAVSWGYRGAQRVIIDAVEEIAYSMLRTQRCYSCPRFAINVKRVEGRRLIRPTLTLRPQGGMPAVTITAQEAELRSDKAENVLKILLRNGTIVVEGDDSYRFPVVYEQAIPLADASRTEGISTSPSRQSLSVIPQQIVKHERLIREYEEELAAQAAYQMLCGEFDQLTSPMWQRRMEGLEARENHLSRLHTEPYRRWAAGFSCFCFLWVGAPLAIRRHKGDFMTNFFLCFLPILTVYYPLLIFGVDGSKHGTVPPVAVWAGNAMLIAWGAVLLRKVVRY